MSRLQFTTAVDVPARRAPCVLGTRLVAVSKGAGARRSTKTVLVASKGWKPGASPPFKRSALNFSHCARFVFLSRAID